MARKLNVQVVVCGAVARVAQALGGGRMRSVVGALAGSGLAVLVLALWPGSAAAEGLCTKTWTGSAGDGLWATAGNWFPAGAPGAGDRACVPSGATARIPTGSYGVASLDSQGTLQISGGSLALSDALSPSQVRSLQLSGGTLDGAGTLTVSESMSWTGGTMRGTGHTVLPAGAIGTIAPSGSVSIYSRTLLNRGVLTWSSGAIFGYDGAWVENEGTLRANAESAAGMGGGGAAPPRFRNTGTVEKTAGTGKTRITFRFDNRQSVRAHTGELSFDGGVTAPTSNGSWTGDAGLISFRGGIFETGRWQLAGDITFAAATVTAAGLDGPASDIQLTSGSLTLSDSASPSQVRRVEMSGGTLTGAATLTVSEALTWTGGSMQGSGQTALANGAISTIAPPSTTSVSIRARTLINNGTLTWTGNPIYGHDGAVIDNRGTLRANSEHAGGLSHSTGAATKLNNAGTIEKTSGTGTTKIKMTVDSRGVIGAATGELSVEGAVTLGGRVEGNVTFPSGSLTLDGLDAPAGEIRFTGGTLSVSDATPSRVGLLILSGGTLNGPGTLTVSEALTWTGGQMLGTGQTVLADGATGTVAPTSGTSVVIGFRRLVNHGTLTWSTSSIWGDNGALIDNHGTLRANSESGGGLSPRIGKATLINRGLLVKAEGTGTTKIGMDFLNAGTVREHSGRFEFTGRAVNVRSLPAEQFGPGNPAMPNFQRTCAGKPVDCATGNQFEVQTDLAVGGRGVGLALVRTYNSQAAAAAPSPGPFGYGWRSSFSDRLVVDAAASVATVTHSDGSSVTFVQAPDGTFIAPPRVQSTLAKNADDTYTYVLPDQRQLTFAADGRVERVADRNANTTTLSYDTAGRLSSITDPAGRSMQLAYDSSGLVSSVTDPTGLKVNYGYASGDLVSVEYEGAAQPQWQFGYDAAHQLTSMTDGRGGTTTTTYDAARRVLSQTDALDRTRTWDHSDGETRITNPAGDVTVQRFDANRQPVSTTTAYGTAAETTQLMGYDADLNLTSVTDGIGKTTTFTHDGAGNTTSVTNPKGETTRWTYDDRRNVTSETAPSGRVTAYAYDARGNLTKESRTLVRAGEPDVVQATSYEHDGRGQLVRMTDPLQRSWTYEYNDAGDVVSETSPSGATTTWTYDAASRVTSTVSPRGNAEGADPAAYMTVITRDGYGRPTDVRDSLGRHTTTKYDANHNPIEVVDAAGRRTEVAYDAENQRLRVERAGLVQRTEYDDNGRVVAQINANGKTTAYHRNAAGQITRIVDPLGRETLRRQDGAGRLIEVTDPLGRTTTYHYDDAGRPTAVEYSATGTPDVAFAYDIDGRRTEMTDGTGTSTYTYDSLGRITSTTNGGGRTVRYGYDLADQLTRLTYPNGNTVARAYDADGRMTSITDWLGNTTELGYDADSNHTTTRFPDPTGNVDRLERDAAGRIASIATTRNGGTLASISITRNGIGQVTGSDWQGLPGTSQTYGYDDFGRLNDVSGAGYAYDPAGNPTKLGGTDGMIYNAADELIQAATADGLVEFDYDGVGNRTATRPASGPSTSYQYDQAGRLTSVERAGDSSIAYAYDGTGLRASKAKDGTTTRFTWDAAEEVPLLLSEGDTSYIYDAGGLPLERISGDGEVVFFHHDQLGSTRMLTDGDGTVVGTYTYDAYGTLAASTGSVVTPFGYAGEYGDGDTGLVYLRARYYDPATGQFLTRDPLEDVSGQPYLYASGDPINNIDPLGLLSLSEIGMGISDAAAGALDGISGGISTKIAGKVIGFDSECADFGAAFDATRIVAENTPWGRVGHGVRGIRGIRSIKGGPRLDRTGKVHGELPDRVPDSWTRGDLEEMADDLRGSIGTRKAEQLRLGEDGPHRERIRQEEQLLRQIEKRLSGS